MFQFRPTKPTAGFTYIELIIVIGITVLIFGAIFLSFRFAIQLGYVSRVKLSAQSLAVDRMEFFRSLPYDDVGVAAGFPAGTIPQNSTFTLNGFTIDERVRVDYVDDPADGSGGADGNLVTTDYKQIKVEYTWTVNGSAGQLSLVSNIVPRAVETSVGGGTIRVNVLDADYTPLSGASVRVLSSSSTFSYDVTNLTDATGAALFSVPADSDYQAFASAVIGGQQYSTSSTYVPTTTNPIPSVAPFAVSEADVSTITFQIGELSDLTILTRSDIVENSILESFVDDSGIASSTNATTTGRLELTDSLGVYDTAGMVYLDVIDPATLQDWEVLRVAADLPIGTSYTVQFFTGSSSTAYTLVPNGDLANNSAGFTDTIIDISALDTAAYPTTTVGISLSTTDTSVTPAIQEIELFWRESETAIGGEGLYVRGDKTIGTLLDSTPIYKSTSSITTDGSGSVTLSDIEFDTYTITPNTTYNVASACTDHPFIHQAGVDETIELIYVTPDSTALRLSVVDGSGRGIPGATVRLERGAYDETQTTNACGQTYFAGGGLVDAADYELTVSSPGYTTDVTDPFDITATTSASIVLSP